MGENPSAGDALPELAPNAIEVLERRYLLKDEEDRVIETPAQMFRRVAKEIAAVDAKYGTDPKKSEKVFYELLSTRRFLPNSPTLMNAGTPIGQLSACFVLPVPDSMDGIFQTLKNMALIHQSGGGTGFSFSRLRPAGDIVKSTSGVASGPLSFIRIFNSATEVVKQGGRRRGANMGVLRVDHPDIIDFINAKADGVSLANFNLSVAVTDSFMDAVARGNRYDLINPRDSRPDGTLDARDVFDRIVQAAWLTGDPGIIFIDQINRTHPLAALGQIESTNPCGEQPLLPNESCNLGSINLAAMVAGGSVDWDELGRVAAAAVRFLDNVIDACRFPVPEIAEVTLANRKIGLGVMGWADMLVRLGVPYTSEEALDLAGKIGAFIHKTAADTSEELARRRGAFPNFSASRWAEDGRPPMRNATLTTVAPTGTISIIAGASSGIEPLFAISFIREAMEGSELIETNKDFERLARARGFLNDDILQEASRFGTIQGIDAVPDDIKELFLTAFDIGGDWQIRMQAAWQGQVDNAVSKTVNLPNSAGPEEVRDIFLLAHRLKCKGTTIYRYGSKEDQVLTIGNGDRKHLRLKAEVEYGGGCAAGECAF